MSPSIVSLVRAGTKPVHPHVVTLVSPTEKKLKDYLLRVKGIVALSVVKVAESWYEYTTA